MIFGVDTSFANGVVDWDQAAKSGEVNFIYARCCYGSDAWDDDGATFVQAHDAAKRLSIPFSPYIFWLAWEDGYGQAQHFLDACNGRYGENAPVVDVEEGSFLHGTPSLEATIANLAACLDQIQKTLGAPIIYTNPDTWNNYLGGTDAFAGHRFIIADYDSPPMLFDTPRGVSHVVGHQFSDGKGQSPIPGLSRPDNNCDRDVCVDLADLRRG